MMYCYFVIIDITKERHLSDAFTPINVEFLISIIFILISQIEYI